MNAAHKFRLGQTVYFTAKPLGHMTANGAYQIVEWTPNARVVAESTDEAFERVAKESQLDRSR